MTIGKPVGRRRSGDSGCTWLTIGLVLGLMCSLVFCLASYVLGFIEIQGLESENTIADDGPIIITPNVITATPNEAVVIVEPTIAQDVALATEEIATGDDTTAAAAEAAQAEGETTLEEGIQATPTLLASGATPTRLPDSPPAGESAGNDTASNEVAAAPASSEEVGTPVPLGSDTPVPQIGSGGGEEEDDEDVPSALLAIASPMVNVDGGTFTMGTTREEGLQAVDNCIVRDGGNCTEDFIEDSTPPHQVMVDPFQIEIFEVSNQQYVTFLNELLAQVPGTRPDLIACNGKPCVLTRTNEPLSIIEFTGEAYQITNSSFYNNHPVVYVTWDGADTYCRTLGRRLPTEAEWERAARGPANSLYPWGPEWIPENANTSRSVTVGGDGTQPVDSYTLGTTSTGVYNMAGNVKEWVQDFYQSNFYSLPAATEPNPTGPPVGELRVVRGGSWDAVPIFARTVHRRAIEPQTPNSSLGFRCVDDL